MWSFVQFMLAALWLLFCMILCIEPVVAWLLLQELHPLLCMSEKKKQKTSRPYQHTCGLSLITLLACEAWLCPWLLKSDTLQGMSWKAVWSLLVFICEPAEKKETYCQWVSRLTHLGCSEINVLCALFWADSWKLCMNVLIIVDEAFPI